MVSRSRESVKDKPSEPELEGNIRQLASANAAVWQAESQGDQVSAGSLGTMLGEVSKVSMEEIDHLISELETLRRKLQSDGDRIERDIRQHAALSEQATRLTKIVFEGMKQLPTRA
jgi:hypothetical protein